MALGKRGTGMSRRTHRTQLLVAAVAALLTSGAAVAQSLVLCLGPDGHRELEIEHRATGCPEASFASDVDASLIKQVPGDCLDLASARMGPMAPSEEQVPTLLTLPPAVLPPKPLLQGREALERIPRAGSAGGLAQIRTTVLLV